MTQSIMKLTLVSIAVTLLLISPGVECNENDTISTMSTTAMQTQTERNIAISSFEEAPTKKSNKMATTTTNVPLASLGKEGSTTTNVPLASLGKEGIQLFGFELGSNQISTTKKSSSTSTEEL